MSNLYATRATMKDRLAISDTVDDSDIDAALEAVSREIDRYCGRRFYVELRTRYYTARHADRLQVDDLISVTTLKTDEDGDRTYEDTWATTDYDLVGGLDNYQPLQESPPEPYTRICTTPDGDYNFPIGVAKGVEIAGKWGYYEVLETLSVTAAEALDATETGLDLSAGSVVAIGDTLLIDSEQFYVTAISATTPFTATVTRGVNGTTAATHSNAAAIQRYTYPIVSEACAEQAILLFRGYAAPTGELGAAGEFSQTIIGGGLHPFVQRMLETFRRARYV